MYGRRQLGASFGTHMLATAAVAINPQEISPEMAWRMEAACRFALGATGQPGAEERKENEDV